MQLRRRLLGGRRASVSVEFALISVFILFPLVAGAIDFITVLNARAQLNLALQTLLHYAWANPTTVNAITSSTTTTTEQALITSGINNNGASTFKVTLQPGTVSGSYSNLLYACVNTSSSPYTITTNSSGTCATGKLQTYVQFKVSTSVSLPFPLPFKLANPYPLSSSGSALISD